MGRLFKIEMKKMWKSTAMRVMVLVLMGLCLLNVAMYAIMVNLFDETILSLGVSGYGVFRMLSSNTSDGIMFTVIFMTMFIGGDFSGRTLSAQIAAGYSRMTIILSRYLAVLVAYLIFYLVDLIVYAGGVTVVVGFGKPVTFDIVSDLIIEMILGLIMSLVVMSLYMFICFLVKSTGASIGICLPFMLIGTNIITSLSYVFETCNKIISFTPFGQLSKIGDTFDVLDYVQYVGVAAVWLAGILAATYAIFRKSELK